MLTEYNKAVRKAKREKLHDSAGLQKALANEHEEKLGSLKTRDGNYTETEEEPQMKLWKVDIQYTAQQVGRTGK